MGFVRDFIVSSTGCCETSTESAIRKQISRVDEFSLVQGILLSHTYMSSVYSPKRKKRKSAKCHEVFHLTDLIHEVLQDDNSFLESRDPEDGSPRKQLCPLQVRAFLMRFCHSLFPTMDGCTSRWDDVARRFYHIVSIAIAYPKFVTVLEEHKTVVDRSLFFCANWFCASKSGYRAFPFRWYEGMCLLLETGQTVKARAATRLPYQMTPEARERMLLFVLRTSFIIARVIHRTTSNFDNKGLFVLEAAELSVRDAHHSPSTELMRERVEKFVNPIRSFYHAVDSWCLLVVIQKVRGVYGARSKFRVLPEDKHADVNDFEDLSAAGPFSALLQEIAKILKGFIWIFRDGQQPGRDIAAQNDLISVLEEVIKAFNQYFKDPGEGLPSAPNISLLASFAVFSALSTEKEGEENEENPGHIQEQPSRFTEPRIFSPILDPIGAAPGPADRAALMIMSAVSCGTAIAVEENLNRPRTRSENASRKLEYPWKSTGHELQAHKDLTVSCTTCAPEYRKLWEHVLFSEYFESVFSACEKLSPKYQRATEGIFIHISLSSVAATKHKEAFGHLEETYAPRRHGTRYNEMIPIVATVIIRCTCRDNGIALDKSLFVASSSVTINYRHGSGLWFGGTVLYCSRVSEVRSDCEHSIHVRNFEVRAVCDCKHSLLVSIVCGILKGDAYHVENLKEHCLSFARSTRTHGIPYQQGDPNSCTVYPLDSTVTLLRCIHAARRAVINDSLWPLISGLPRQARVAAAPQRHLTRDSRSISSKSSHNQGQVMEFVALACQILRTLGKVNQGQWAFMQEIVQSFDARNNMREWPAILLEGPPGTGKTTTISKLLSLLYHNTPAYRNLTPNGRRRSPSLRSLICTASNAGLDQILSSFVKEGIATLNFDEITGMRQERQSGSSNGFEDALMTLFDKVEKGKVTYESMFGSRTIRAQYNHVDSLDEDVESDIRVLRLGRTDNEVARSFALMQGRSPGMEDDDLFTEAHGTGGFLAAPASALAAIREADVIFTTCSTSGSNLMQHNPGPFDLILIDESAQATEPEALIPLSAHFGPNTVLVLVGDTHQLGPVVKSQVPSTRTILGTSILERLSKSRRESIVSLRLNVQYRMHEDIASFISRRFYACGLSSDISRRRAKDLHLLGARVSAVCVDTSSFCGNSLTSLQVSRYKNLFFEKSVGSSFTNIGESILVAKIIRSVLFENGELRPSDIAVITPYAAQKKVIREHIVEIEGKQSLNIEVDTMDAFQGSERSVVIIDLVRSQGNTIGFIGDERRSNVALSRAKDLLIVVGNMATMLSNSPNPWVEWKDHCTSLHISNVISDETRLSKLWRLDPSTSKQ